VNYTYGQLSERDGRFYAGSTTDLRARVREHTAGRVRSTASRTPLVLIYYEACVDLDDARRRDRFLKTGKGKRYLNNRLSAYLSAIRSNKLERD
jgi:putative endonuclease